jgi:hypothetical protein
MLTLTRIRSPRQTQGLLRLGDDPATGYVCCTLELPWRRNKNRRSCIPPGPGEESITYEARKHESPRFGDTIYIPGVSERNEILVHAGNYVSDTLGCILVGRRFTDLNGNDLSDVTASRETLRQLLERLPDEPFEFTIRWADAPEPAALADVGEVSVEQLVAGTSGPAA